MAEGKKKSSKMTWNRLKNDASIQKNELVRIAKAFGITPPKGWKDTKTREVGGPTGRERSRTEGMAKPKPKAKAKPPTAKAKSSMQKAFSKPRTKLAAEKPKAKARPKSTFRVHGPDSSGRTPTRMATGTEGGFEEGTYRQRVKRVQGPGGKAGKQVTLKKVKQPGAKRTQFSSPKAKGAAAAKRERERRGY